MADTDTGTNHVPAPLLTEGDGPNYAVLLNGEPLSEVDAGGVGKEGYVQTIGRLDGEDVFVTVSTGRKGTRGVVVEWVDRDLEMGLDPADDQPDSGLRFEGSCLGIEAAVRIKPETEVDL